MGKNNGNTGETKSDDVLAQTIARAEKAEGELTAVTSVADEAIAAAEKATIRAEKAESELTAVTSVADEAVATADKATIRAEKAEAELSAGGEKSPKEDRGEINIFDPNYTGPISCDQAERIHKHRAAQNQNALDE